MSVDFRAESIQKLNRFVGDLEKHPQADYFVLGQENNEEHYLPATFITTGAIPRRTVCGQVERLFEKLGNDSVISSLRNKMTFAEQAHSQYSVGKKKAIWENIANQQQPSAVTRAVTSVAARAATNDSRTSTLHLPEMPEMKEPSSIASVSTAAAARATVVQTRDTVTVAESQPTARASVVIPSSEAAAQNLDPQALIFINAVRAKQEMVYKNPKTGLLVAQKTVGAIPISLSEACIHVQKYLQNEHEKTALSNTEKSSLSDDRKLQLVKSAEEVAKFGVTALENEMEKFEEVAHSFMSQVMVSKEARESLNQGFQMRCAQTKAFALNLNPQNKGGVMSVKSIETLQPSIVALNARLKQMHQSMQGKRLSTNATDATLAQHLELFEGSQTFVARMEAFKDSIDSEIKNVERDVYVFKSHRERDFRKLFYQLRDKLSGGSDKETQELSLEGQLAADLKARQLTYPGYVALVKETRLARLKIVEKMRKSYVFKELADNNDNKLLKKDMQSLEDFVTQRLKLIPARVSNGTEQKS